MKKFLILNLLFLLTSMNILNAQVRKIVLLEEATNTSCPPCAENNPKLQAFFKTHFGGVISVRYHAWWPGENDPMYLLNPLENRNRIQNYYGIWGVPHYFMDGINYGEPLDSTIMIDQMQYHLFIDTPVQIKVNAVIDADSVKATLKLIGVSPVLQSHLKFRSAIIERMVQYSTSPGSNGESIFPDVFRKMLPDTNGFAIDYINPGQEITRYVSYPVNPEWNWQDLAVVAWLQSDENQQIPVWPNTINHQIIQSNISIPTYIIQSDDPFSGFLYKNSSYSKTFKIINDNDVSLNLRLKVTQAQIPIGWSYILTHNNIIFDSLDVSIALGDSIVFGLNINTNSDPGIIRLAVFAQNLDDPYNYGYTANCLGITKTENSNVLFIDDDGGGNSEINYCQALDKAGVCYTSIEGGLVSALIKPLLDGNFKAIFWNIGERSRIVTRLDIVFLENYLENGGNLFIAVSDPGYFYNWDYQATIDFCHNYLDAESYGYFTSISSFIGIEGTLGNGIITNLDGSYRGLLGSHSGNSDTIFQYSEYPYTQQYGGLSYDCGTYKTVFLGVGLEQFTSASARQSLIQSVVNWFEVPVGVLNEKNNIPDQYNLQQNYPNPFNPSTEIKYSVPQISNVVIKVFDILGNEIKILVNEEKQAGTYELTWNAVNLPSGVYFYQLKAGNYIETKKMVLLR